VGKSGSRLSVAMWPRVAVSRADDACSTADIVACHLRWIESWRLPQPRAIFRQTKPLSLFVGGVLVEEFSAH